MKTILFTIVIPLLLTAGLAERADAQCHSGGSTYVSGRASCGCPVYTQRYVAYYNNCGQPVYRYRTLPVRHSCHSRTHVTHGSHGYGHSVVRRSSSYGVRSNIHAFSPISKHAVPHISFSSRRGVHVGIGCR